MSFPKLELSTLSAELLTYRNILADRLTPDCDPDTLERTEYRLWLVDELRREVEENG